MNAPKTELALYLLRRGIMATQLATELDYAPNHIRIMARGEKPTPRVVLLACAELERRALEDVQTKEAIKSIVHGHLRNGSGK